ncbi:hypothetical protein GOFOIKOB_4004 [Methylobacterium tardum]|uniref:HD-GYP domain-containing protein n=1 Tax=Methylobacterium tardum TaxID=374432 RepID=A0AA37WRE1_9HYPH|nr:HD-GYP domain-containing protein [Methylobacterium tardum]GJE50950.1 hypothetical protein GOFOIKOB_4004 [Methylobacterium tardum]GLS69954.1 hypothetical protein GCM10007890_19670 [Methylobacterium tardum]
MHILFLTDTLARTQRLARNLGRLDHTRIVDVLDPFQSPSSIEAGGVKLIVSDVASTRSDILAALRLYLDALRKPGMPFFCVLNGTSPRAEVQAAALKPTRIMAADQLAEPITLALGSPAKPAGKPESPGFSAHIAGAQTSLTEILARGRAGRAIDPALITTGAAYIESALRESDIRVWLELVWRFDDATHQHCLLVAGLAAGFGQKLGLSRPDCERLTQAGLLHDIGKSRIPLAILNKPGRLDEGERAVMQTHPAMGYAMLQGHGYSADMLAVVRSHHEFLDGSGYPDHLHGRAIPDLVRLITICDIYGALIDHRPYKTAMEPMKAYDLLASMTGKVDPDLVRAFHSIAIAAGAADLKVTA